MKEEPTISRDTDLPLSRVVRRYLDLPKYIDLLRSQSLYFAQAATFPDRFEGALTPAFRRGINEAHKAGEIDYDADTYCLKSRAGVYASCWSLGAQDNMALWQLYGGASRAIAVTTTVAKLLRASLFWGENVIIHKVRYINHFSNPDMILGRYTDMFQYKHVAYSFEDEVRVLITRFDGKWEDNPRGIRMSIGSLRGFVRSIVVGPEADDWFFDLVKDVTRRYGMRGPVRRSKLTYLPR
jgi:hypothetical protein